LKEQGGTTKPRGGVAEYSMDVGRWREATSWSSCFRGAAALSRSRLDFSARDAHVAGAACIASRSAAHLADQHAPIWGPPPRRAAQLTSGRALARARQAQHAEEPPECCNGSTSAHAMHTWPAQPASPRGPRRTWQISTRRSGDRRHGAQLS
jgi:hypothetical protein